MANYAGNSNSSSLDFEPLDIGSYLSMPIRIFVPEVSQGSPLSGFQDTIECFVTSSTRSYTQLLSISHSRSGRIVIIYY